MAHSDVSAVEAEAFDELGGGIGDDDDTDGSAVGMEVHPEDVHPVHDEADQEDVAMFLRPCGVATKSGVQWGKCLPFVRFAQASAGHRRWGRPTLLKVWRLEL